MKERKEISFKFWDRVAGKGNIESIENPLFIRYLDMQFGVHILPSDTVLDYGCGPGTITLYMASRAHKVYGVDGSDGMLKWAETNLKEQKKENTTFLKLTGLDKMFDPATFNVVTIFNVLQYIENRDVLFKQVGSLLKSSGVLIIAAPCFNAKKSFIGRLIKFLGSIRIMPKTYFFTIEEFENEITNAGFTIIKSMDLSKVPEKFIVAVKNSLD